MVCSKMAHQGRCSARSQAIAFLTTLILVQLLHNVKTTQAATFAVGDASGWTHSAQSWASGKNFKAGDALVFKYDLSLHNVAIVDASGYNSCTASPGSITYTSGNDRIKLKEGKNYFICTIPGHCDAGMKLTVNASKIREVPAPVPRS